MLSVPPAPNRVVLIEANGTTDPLFLIEHLMAHAELRNRFSPLLQVGIADLRRWQKRGEQNDLEFLQLTSASHFSFTRRDEVDEERLSKVRDDIQWINPRAVEADRSSLAEELLGLLGGIRRLWGIPLPLDSGD